MMTLNECLTDASDIFLVPKVEPKKSIFRPKQKKIYRKAFNHAEFIGEQLCSIRNLQCAHYFIIGEGFYDVNRTAKYGTIHKSNYDYKIGSVDFKKAKNQYFDFQLKALGSYSDYLEMVLDMTPTERNRKELQEEIEEMFALDTYMGQCDRIHSNIMFSKNRLTGEIHLAPLYDFQYSLKTGYKAPGCIYSNPLHSFQKLEDYYQYFEKSPSLREKLSTYLSVSLKDNVRSAYCSRGLRVPDDKYIYYEEFDEKQKELIKKIVK